MISRKNWEEVSCNLCKSKKEILLWDKVTFWEHKSIFRIVKCNKCGLVFLNPRPKRKIISRYYQKKSYWGIDLLNGNEKQISYKKMRRMRFQGIYKEILRRKKGGIIFDVGAGTGLFLSKFKELGWGVDGIEVAKEACEFAKKNYHIDLRCGDFHSMRERNNYYDVIVMESVLEHLHNPGKCLKKVRNMLKKNSLLVITVPNIEGLGALIFKKRWLGLHPPKHLYHFSKDTISKILKIYGFEIDKISNWNWSHSYYSLFNSARYMLSPRFKTVNKTTSKEKQANQNKSIITFLVKNTGKILFAILAALGVVTGLIIDRSEIITVYAKKT